MFLGHSAVILHGLCFCRRLVEEKFPKDADLIVACQRGLR